VRDVYHCRDLERLAVLGMSSREASCSRSCELSDPLCVCVWADVGWLGMGLRLHGIVRIAPVVTDGFSGSLHVSRQRVRSSNMRLRSFSSTEVWLDMPLRVFFRSVVSLIYIHFQMSRKPIDKFACFIRKSQHANDAQRRVVYFH
jgi:hypothetical protein